MKICVYGAASSLIDESYINAGIELGKKMVEKDLGLVFGGGSHGMMGAVAEGVYEKKGYILGVIPEFFKEAESEESFNECTDYIYTETMRERKRELEENSNAFIVTPGGIGTLDEFFEILTLKQLGRHNKPIAIFNINGFYDELDVMMTKSIKEKFITDDCKELYKVFTDVDEMLEYIYDAGLFHDIGKTRISNIVKCDYRYLTNEEFNVIKEHPTLGAELTYNSNYLRNYEAMIKGHHKFYNNLRWIS